VAEESRLKNKGETMQPFSVFSVVDNEVWRGPRPQAENFDAIKNQFKTVLSLEGPDEDAKEIVELAPITVISRPISLVEIYATGISQVVLNETVLLIQSVEKPILVHCQHGEDRTGLIIAAYRVRVNGWMKGKAMAEALHFGYRDWLNFGLNRTWKNFEG
jgi:tyrosine-protein phosphatase SIW14